MRRLARLALALMLVTLAAPLAHAIRVVDEPDVSPPWWAEVKDEWDRAWEDAWSRDRHEDPWLQEEDDDWAFDGPSAAAGTVRFRYRDAGYTAVELTGDWIEWGTVPLAFDEEAGLWEASVDVGPGRHYYRFIVSDGEGEWEAIDPEGGGATRLDDRGWVSVLEMGNRGIRLHVRDERRERWRINREFEVDYGDEDAGLSYQRVDGLVLGFMPDYIGSTDFEPSVKGQVAYGFESERWTLGVTLLQPLAPRNRAWFKARAYTGTGYAQRTGIGDGENTLAAVFFREDYRDYYEREGASFSVVTRALPWLRAEVGLRSEDHASLANTATWSVRRGSFRPNLPVDEGTLRSVYSVLRLGSSHNYLELGWERAGDDVLGGDFDFSLAEATWRSRLPMGPRQRLDLRVAGGSNLRGTLPLQRRYLPGGLGTVRGFDYQSLVVPDPADSGLEPARYGGERMLLANLEYGFEVDSDVTLYGLYDTGLAWADRDADVHLNDLRDSAGLGIGFDDDQLRINVMRPLDEDADLVWELRVEHAF
ncbi:MAG: DUF5686 family protein [Candidatus Krumholzibacteriia bacterium]|nr:BamA/TamA family outer membrane protein [Candidatus Latescibacterota bacterium]